MDDHRISECIRMRTQRGNSLMLRCMAEVGQKRIAELIGVSETTVSNMKSDHLERFAALVAACGLRLTLVTDQTYDESAVSALKTLAAIGIDRVRPNKEYE